MTDDTPLPFDLSAVQRKKLTIDFDGGNQSSDAGLILLRQAEKKVGVCQRLAEALPDRRDPSRIRHEMVELVMARAVAISCLCRPANYAERAWSVALMSRYCSASCKHHPEFHSA